MCLLAKVSNLAIRVSNEILMPIFNANTAKDTTSIKDDGSWVTVADTQAHNLLSNELPRLYALPVLSEELTTKQQEDILNHDSPSYWCIDPLDGTSNYTQSIPYWCISIALIIDGEIELGVVYDPNRDECFATMKGRVTTVNGKPITEVSDESNLKLSDTMALIDFKRLSPEIAGELILKQPYRSQRSFGASALDLCWIAANRCQVYLHGKQMLWDHAAGLIILANANAKATTFDHAPIFENNLKPKNVIAASNERMMSQWQNYFDKIQLTFSSKTILQPTAKVVGL
ncbi:MAG: inositol monophosphatase [Gammaproteobacteria bacterium]|nr:MAG: inositol monophosphatase [Gammaproteobacteria bacterium]